MFCEGVVVVCVCIGECLAININIYFALQKNNKKTNMRLMTVEECFFRCRLAVCSFFFSINFNTNKGARAHTHALRFTETRPFERLAANGLRVPDPEATKMLGCHREAVTLPHTGVTRGPEAGSTNALVGGPLVKKVTRLCVCVGASVGFCVSVCVCR